MRLLLFLVWSMGFAQTQPPSTMTTTVSHQPVEVLRTVAGTNMNKVALYELITCNMTPTSQTVSEGRMLEALTTKVASISAVAAPGIIERSKRRTRKYIALRTLEYLGFGVALYATKGKASALSNKLAFSGLAANGVASKIADSMKSQEESGMRVMQTLVDVNRMTEIPIRGCVLRMAFGEYKGAVPVFVVSWTP